MSDVEVLIYIILMVFCLAFSAFFSSSETAFISLQKAKLQHQVNTKVKGAERVARILQKPERFLSTVLLGNNLVNTAIAAMATALAVHFIGDEEEGILVATIGVTIILLIFGDVTPKTVASHHAERLSRLYAQPMEWLSWLFTPFVWLLSTIAAGFAKLAGGKPVSHSLASEEEIRAMITVGRNEGVVADSEAEMLHNVFDFTDQLVREVMVPRTGVVFVEKGARIGEFLAIYAESPRSRYPVFQERRDNVLGILAIKDVLMALAKDEVNKDSLIDDFVRPVHFTPETKHVAELLHEMRDKNFHMAVVVDEFGGTAGVVTIDQMVEEIVGPMGDDFAGGEKDFEVIDAHTYEIDGGMRIDEANDEMELDLPEGDYETMAGFILHLLRRIPKENEQLRYKSFKLVIKEMRGVKIERILLIKESHATPQD